MGVFSTEISESAPVMALNLLRKANHKQQPMPTKEKNMYKNNNLSVDNQWIKDTIAAMTLDEKIGLVHGNALFKNKGVDRLGIEPLIMSDGPMSVRFDFKDDEWFPIDRDMCYVSWLPSGAALAATWNTELANKSGQVLGSEALARGKHVILAPGINIHRTPLCGRNFEYMSEDPYLTGKIATSVIKGVQNNDVAVCVKHFALNNQEKYRMTIDAKIEDRALYEIYLPAFKEALTEGNAYSLMCSYNKINGTYASENHRLLTEILRDEWNYDGVVISDWGAVHSTAPSALAGCDLEMSVTYNFDDYFFAKPLKEAVLNGEVPESVIDEKVARILLLQKRIKLYEGTRKRGEYSTTKHHQILLEAAGESIVLLKNDRNILPLDTKKCPKIAVIGDAAKRPLACGGGSSEATPLFEITPLMGINMVTGSHCIVKYAPGYYVDNEEHVTGDVDWQATSLDACDDEDSVTDTDAATADGTLNSPAKGNSKGIINSKAKKEALLNEAINLAKECDVVIYVGGLNRAYDTEGFDRTSYDLPYNQYEVIDALLKVKPNMVISILSGSAINLSPFNDKASAILWNSMAGMQGGLALAQTIFGDVNPSGKLPVSFPVQLSDCSAHSTGSYPCDDPNVADDQKTCTYSEGIYVGYRHYITNNVKPLYSFGYGLSYTSFEYSDLNINELNNNEYEVSFKVKNTGDVSGKEVCQLYVTANERTVDSPAIELKGFTKVNLNPGEQKECIITVNKDAFSYYSESSHGFICEPGSYTISIGSSSDKLILRKDINISVND